MRKLNYQHVSQSERDRIEALLMSGHKQKEVASILGRDKGTISREVARNRRRKRKRGRSVQGPYEATTTNHKAYLRRKYAKYQGKKINENDDLKNYIIAGLKKHWSPDEISGRMKREDHYYFASKNVIYGWLYSVWGQQWCKYLYSKRYRPRRRKSKKTKKALIPNRIGIELRPREISERLAYGHYESDTIVSGKKTGSREALAVIGERKFKFVGVRKIKSLQPRRFNRAVEKIKNEVRMDSLTLDNGIENQDYEQLGLPTYFCDPYSSWQKGGVENLNKMIRRFIPKGVDIANYSHQYVKKMVTVLNNKPRKSLNYQTPYEAMVEHNLFIKNKTPEVALGGGI